VHFLLVLPSITANDHHRRNQTSGTFFINSRENLPREK